MKNYIKLSTIAILAGAVSLASCKKQLDINTDPNQLQPGQVSVSDLLPSGIQYIASAYYNTGSYGLFYTQYLGGNAGYANDIDAYRPYGFDGLWSAAYLSAMPNFNDIIKRADEAGAPQYAGAARLMMALTLMQSTDIWGDIPYKEAFLGSANVAPHYEPQEEIYTQDLKALLDQAIDDLNQPVPDLASLKLGNTDLIYKGDVEKWKKAAYAARARYYLHLSVKDPANYQKAADDANLAFDDQTGAGDMQLQYTQETPNPWNSLAISTSRYARPGQYYVNLMNGNADGVYPGLFDPRLPKVVEKSGDNPEYIGRPVGTEDNEAGAEETNVDITENTFYGQRTSFIPIITYAEVQFIKAEALFNIDKDAAYTAYIDGIKGSMMKWGVAEADMDTYINSPIISKGAANLTLSDIMLQKYISLFMQMETWTDMRRYQYDTAIYKGLATPLHDQLGDGVWVQRGNYPDNEPGRNPNVPKNMDQKTKIWLFNN